MFSRVLLARTLCAFGAAGVAAVGAGGLTRGAAGGLPAGLSQRSVDTDRKQRGAISDAAAPVLLDGYCPVELVDQNTWTQGDAGLWVTYQGSTYHFKCEEAKSTFLKAPERYAVAFGGIDIVTKLESGIDVPGRRECGYRYRGRVFLFENPVTGKKFVEHPDRYVQFSPKPILGDDRLGEGSPSLAKEQRGLNQE